MKRLKILACIALGFLFLFLFGSVTMLLWNWLVPELFNGPLITFWQALGLLLLSKILFSSPWGKGGSKCGNNNFGSAWQSKMSQKFSNLSPEEREALKSKMIR